MNRDDIAAKVKTILADQVGWAEDQITESHSIHDDLGCDSLDDVEIVMAIEEEFSIEINDEDAEKIQTVGDAINAINKRLNE